MQCTTNFTSPDVHLLVSLPCIRPELQRLRRDDGAMAEKFSVWILLITTVKDLWQGLGNPGRVGIDKSKQGCELMRQLIHNTGV